MTDTEQMGTNSSVYRLVLGELELLSLNNITTKSKLKSTLKEHQARGYSLAVAGALTCRDLIPVTRAKLYLLDAMLPRFINWSDNEDDSLFIERLLDEQREELRNIQLQLS